MRILQQQIDSVDFAELLAADRINPWPDPWREAGTIAAASANVWGAKVTPDDFIPRAVEIVKPKTPEEIEAYMRAMDGA